MPGYHASNLLIGTPEASSRGCIAAQEACSFSEVTIVPQFGTMPGYADGIESVKLFAGEVLPAVHEMAAPARGRAASGRWHANGDQYIAVPRRHR